LLSFSLAPATSGWIRTLDTKSAKLLALVRDRCEKLVEFTRAGVGKYEGIFAVSTHVGEMLFEKLSSADVSQLKRACAKLRAGVAGRCRLPQPVP
jgi:hypothetical protein